MNNNPKISIIVPVYNVEQYLLRCIDSILAQTFTDFEVLLVDDGSKDRSGAICDEYAAKDRRVRVFHKPNGGVSSARNVGLENARGEWIGFVDSDDYVKEDFLAAFFKQRQDADMLSQGFYSPNWMNKSAMTISEKDEIIDGDSLASFVLRMTKTLQIGYLWCKLFRRQIIEKYSIRFEESVCHMEDRLFVYNYLSHSNRVINSSYDGYVYIFSASGKKFGKQNVMKLLFNLLNYFLKIKGAHLIEQEIKEGMSYEILSALCNSENYKEADEKLVDSYFKDLYNRRMIPRNSCRKKFLLLSYIPTRFMRNTTFRRFVFYVLTKVGN